MVSHAWNQFHCPIAQHIKLYYLIIPEGGVGTGWQTVLRARNIYGPYERRIVLEQGSTNVNGPHQGALVDTSDGQWWFYHFQETPVLGRVVHLQPAHWEDDWPVIGIDYDGNGIGEPVVVGGFATAVDGKAVNSKQPFALQTDDDFSGTLGLQWQWNHNPVDTHWSLNDCKGWLTLRAMPADSLKQARNMLTQKVVGYQSESTTLVSSSGRCYAGLFCSGKLFRGIGLCQEGIFIEAHGHRQIVKQGKYDKVWLRLTNDCIENSHQFYYSTDGRRFKKAGDAFPMRLGYWKGIRTGLFCYGEDGLAQFDYYHVE